jgi:hypothetical protein
MYETTPRSCENRFQLRMIGTEPPQAVSHEAVYLPLSEELGASYPLEQLPAAQAVKPRMASQRVHLNESLAISSADAEST